MSYQRPRLLLTAIATAGTLAAARARAKPLNIADVTVTEKEPIGCVFRADLEDEKLRLHPFKKNKTLYDKALRSLKARAARIGADTLYVTHREATTINAGVEAKAYTCDAEAPAPKPEATPPSVEEKKRPRDAFVPEPQATRRSADLRVGKRSEVAGEIGTSLAPATTLGVRYGYFLSPASLLEASITAGNHDDNDEFDETADKFKVATASVRFKQFWTNSFYTDLGGGLRSMERILHFDRYTFSGVDTATEYRGKTVSLVGDVAIGNAWQFDNFIIGADWFGVMVPVIKVQETETFSDERIKQASETKIKEFRKDRQAVSGQALRFYCGASF